ELPRRIVAASVLSAEVIVAIAPRDRIAGVIQLAADPRYSEAAADVAGLPLVGAEAERLVAARPALVFTGEFTRAGTPRLLGAAGVAVVRTHAVADLDDVADNVRLIGWATGCDAAAEQLVQGMRARAAAIAGDAAGVRDWRIMNLNGELDTYGAGSLLDAV